MKLKFLAILTVVCLMAALTACSSADGGAEAGGSQSVPDTEAAADTDADVDTDAAADTEAAVEADEAAGEPAIGPVVSFEAVDLDGNTVNSAEIFGENKLTMINLWGTFCGPCIAEMPDLEILSGRLADKGCGLIGVVCDIGDSSDSAHIVEAKEIIGETGVTYLNLIPWEDIWSVMPAQYIPTTYFVDSEGHLLGSETVGSRGADDYEALVDELLQAIED